MLSIIDTVLRSNDINMIEESIPAFETFCKHHDVSALNADIDRSKQYQDIVRKYATFASEDPQSQPRSALSAPVLVRWRTAGLQAIKSAVSSEALGTDGGKQLQIVVPVILQNLYSSNDDILSVLQARAQNSEKTEMEQARKRRMSMTKVATVDTMADADPASASGTTADADKLAEEEVRVLAGRCLKEIFSATSNRGQVRLATALTLRFIWARNPPGGPRAQVRPWSSSRGNWATSLIETVARWTPVQDRFIIVVTAVETLTRSPIIEDKLDQQLSLATMVDWLLGSSINLIGLSVMDVLLGLIQHILLLLQLGGGNSKVLPHPQQKDATAIDLFQDAQETFNHIIPSTNAEMAEAVRNKEVTPSATRQQLLTCLQKCCGNLATHIYYTDQISDMIAAILARLKPSASSDITTATAIENPAATANAIANSVNLQEDPSTDGFFSFATARVTALRAVKDILVVANLRRAMTGAAPEARSRVGIQVWEGTQWLLCDEDREVRQAYVDAILTWLKLETSRNDLRLSQETPKRSKGALRREAAEGKTSKLTKRAVSNASQREKVPARRKSTYLQLLHLAIYDNAIESPEMESDILLLHLLLVNLIERLGVNAARHGLPMIIRLQEDINLDDIIGSPRAKINVGSLVHGYFWALSEKFDFEASKPGSEIHSEISRRKKKDLWLEKIRLPPMPLDQFRATEKPCEKDMTDALISEALKPHDGRAELVEEVAIAYDAALASPAPSAPNSPGRAFSVPALGFGYGYGVTPAPKPAPEDQLPQEIKEQMLKEWSKDLCLAFVEKESTRTISLSGSRTGASGRRNYLAVNANESSSRAGDQSPPSPHHHHQHQHRQDQIRPSSGAFGLVGGLGALAQVGRASAQDGSPTPLSSSSRDSTVRVHDLKRVLSVNNGVRHSSPLRGRPAAPQSVTDSDSMVSDDGEYSVSDIDVGKRDFKQEGVGTNDFGSTLAHGPGSVRNTSDSTEQPLRDRSPQTQSTHVDQSEGRASRQSTSQEDEIPPVPPLPASLSLPSGFPIDSEGASRTSNATGESLTDVSRQGRSVKRGKGRPTSKRADQVSESSWGGSSFEPIGGGKVNLGKLLGGIVVAEDREDEAKGLGRPPY